MPAPGSGATSNPAAAFGWLIAAVIMAITIIGLPWARAAFNIAVYTLIPFGQRAVSRELVTGQHDIGTGLFGLLGNLIWLVLAGWWLAPAQWFMLVAEAFPALLALGGAVLGSAGLAVAGGHPAYFGRLGHRPG